MNLLIFLLTFIVFLFTLYRLVKDDHVFLRKNIKHEQIFDSVFLSTIIGLVFSQFTYSKDSMPIPQVVLGGSIALFLIGRFKKFPIGRFFDFFSISFLNSITILFLINGLFLNRSYFAVNLFEALIYLLLAIFFSKFFIPRIMSRTIRDGKLSIYIFCIYSFFSLLVSIFNLLMKHVGFWNAENVSLIAVFAIAIISLFKQIIESK
ncbi:MAG TPA: hypothetical protein VLG67_00760 [Candidatus Saccharimonadales bacterium]|nr:hypothetical protein [Candidatus Saccharimonadales bacterium]